MALQNSVKVDNIIDFLKTLWHGLPTDLTMSGYLMTIPLIVTIVWIWRPRKRLRKFMTVYLWVIAALISVVYVIDGVLFPFWGFRIDTTPFFYFFSSPKSALASISIGAELIILLFTFLFTVGFFMGMHEFTMLWYPKIAKKARVKTTLMMCVFAAVLVLGIRGGVSEATMTPGRGFFSSDIKLNQATVNPMFSLAYSAMHEGNTEGQFRYYPDDDEARFVFAGFEKRNSRRTKWSRPAIASKNPDVYIIILESFSAEVMPSLGGEPIAEKLDSLAVNEGLLFIDFYAESFRTDRAIPAILSGYPGQPTTSVMRMTSKLSHMPGLASQLGKSGWKTIYYYGGDADFTNMNAYLLSSGFEDIISEDDFKRGERQSKWGVYDHVLFDRVISDIHHRDDKPYFTVIQTSSSHEPFTVPYNKFTNERANAFAYTDECVVDFVDNLKAAGKWDNSLVLIVADHWGCYPKVLNNLMARHHIPLIITGGVVKSKPSKIPTVGSQSDIAPTLLAMLGIEPENFKFGHDLFDSSTPEYARVSEHDWFGLIDEDNYLTAVSVEDGLVMEGDEPEAARALMQLLYSDLSKKGQ